MIFVLAVALTESITHSTMALPAIGSAARCSTPVASHTSVGHFPPARITASIPAPLFRLVCELQQPSRLRLSIAEQSGAPFVHRISQRLRSRCHISALRLLPAISFEL